MSLASPSSLLWHMHSSLLEGFYQSDILVAAPDRDTAIALAVKAVGDWIENRAQEYGVALDADPDIIFDPDPEPFRCYLSEKIDAFRAEIEERLAPVPGNALVMHKS